MRTRIRSRIKVRVPVPRPTRFHSTPKGKKGYDRRRLRREDLPLRRIS